MHLVDDEKDVESKDVKLPGDGDVEVAFDYTASAVGTHILKVYVAPQNGEVNLRNNSATATVDVMKGKYSVLLVAGEPALDVAFLRRNIESSDDFELTTLVQKDANDFYVPTGENGREVNASTTDPSEILSKKYDAVLLSDFPNAHFSVATNHDSPMQKGPGCLELIRCPIRERPPLCLFRRKGFFGAAGCAARRDFRLRPGTQAQKFLRVTRTSLRVQTYFKRPGIRTTLNFKSGFPDDETVTEPSGE